MATTIKGIKSGKAAGEYEIRPEMLKAQTGEGILWLTRVCQVAWKYGKTPRDWQTDDTRKEIASNGRTTEGYHSSVCQKKYTPNASVCQEKIIPIYKKGDRKQCTNYRGISLLSLPGKVYA